MAADIGLFVLAEQRLEWVGQRQKQLAENVSNADTPGYRSKDLSPFASALSHFQVSPSLTSPLHLAGFSTGGIGTRTASSEKGPDGNAVNVEDEMTKVADDENTQALVGNIWKSYMGMFMTALGRAG